MHHPSLPPACSPTIVRDVVVGAGAAGLFAAIHAGRTARGCGRIVRPMTLPQSCSSCWAARRAAR